MINKSDLKKPDDSTLDRLIHRGLKPVVVSAVRGEGLAEVREALVDLVPDDFLNAPTILADLVPPGECAVLVVPVDKEAPKGRLILPQSQAIRDLLDNDSYAIVVKERELREALDRLKRKPALVVTDSQAFLKVAADTPPDVPLTSFSILFARQKGDLLQFARRSHRRRRGVFAPSHRRRHRPRKDPAMAQPVRGRRAHGRPRSGPRLHR